MTGDTIPISDLSRDASLIVAGLQTSNRPLVITREGEAAAVLMSIDAFERGEREREILRGLARGEAEVAAGLGYDLDDVLAEADARLAEDTP